MANALDVNVVVVAGYEAQIMSAWTEHLRACWGDSQKL